MILGFLVAAFVLGAFAVIVVAMAWGYAAGEADIRSSVYREQQARQRLRDTEERRNE